MRLSVLRLVGTSWQLTRQRMEHEVAALRRFGALCPQHVPAVPCCVASSVQIGITQFGRSRGLQSILCSRPGLSPDQNR